MRFLFICFVFVCMSLFLLVPFSCMCFQHTFVFIHIARSSHITVDPTSGSSCSHHILFIFPLYSLLHTCWGTLHSSCAGHHPFRQSLCIMTHNDTCNYHVTITSAI
ncbi:hypothetical protein DFH29DRAFT_949632 [Suillus ampliporus]|nr:hypothetical protein DFH29DRAFT_949632 [Suillus ampliporus]